jgi:hypothetical protein
MTRLKKPACGSHRSGVMTSEMTGTATPLATTALSSKTISNPAMADATKQGPQRNLCSFSPAAYRTFNKGAFAAGPFVTKVYRDNTLVHTHNVPVRPRTTSTGTSSASSFMKGRT